MRRLLRILLRLGIVLVALGILAVLGFTWLAYWPLEGTWDAVENVVPADVDFVYKGSWTEIRDRGWLKRHAIDEPVFPGLEKLADLPRDAGVDRVERSIDDGLPGPIKFLRRVLFGTDEFRVEKDLLAGDVVIAGSWCSGVKLLETPPRRLLLATRVSSQVKFAFEAMKRDFIRSRALPPDAGVTLDVTSDGVLRVQTTDPAIRARGKPRPCEGGAESDTMDVWWVARRKDVIVAASSEDLLARALEAADGHGDRAVDRPGFELPRVEGGISAALDLTGVRSWLLGLFGSNADGNRAARFLGKFLAIESLDRANASVGPLISGDGILALANVTYSPERLRAFKDVSATYALSPRPMREGIAAQVPAKDTVAVAQLITPPRALLGAVYDSLEPDDRRLIEENVARLGADRRARGENGYPSVADFLDDIATQLESNTGVAVARIPSAFDAAKFDTWYVTDEPSPTVALALTFGIPKGKTPEQVDKYLSDRVAAMGFAPPEPVTSPDGITYSRLKLALGPEEGGHGSFKPKDLELVQPAYRSGDGRLVLATREDYLLDIVRTMRGGADAPKSLLQSKSFDAATRDLPADATVGLFVDGENFRKLLWDYRNTLVRSMHDDTEHARSFRASVAEKARREGRAMPDPAKINAEVDAEMARFRGEGYGKYVEELRATLSKLDRLGGAAVVLTSRADSQLETGATIVFSSSTAPK